MIWSVYCVGTPTLKYARIGVEFYLDRLKHYTRCEIEYLKGKNRIDNDRRFLEQSKGAFRMALDESGLQFGSRRFSESVNDWRNRSVQRIALYIGGADGHSSELKKDVDLLWSLGQSTLQHELALVVLLEQIYRAHTILRGEPYHRD